MKNSNLLNRLLSYSHEKQKPQRFGRYAVMLLMLLTLGVGQMWADSSVTGASIKYDVNSSSNHWWNVSSTPKDLGQVYTFTLKGFWAQLGTENVCQNTCIYYGLTSACSLGSYNIKDPNDWSPSTKHFQTESMNVNILSGLTPNKYTLYAKFIGHGKKSGNDCGEISSSTYQMKFEYPAYLTGDGTWCGTEWNTTADAQKMTYNAGGYYSKTVSSVTQADHKLKVSTYNWASSWGHAKYDATNSSNVYSESNASGNIQFQPAMAGDVTIKFNISDQKISIICAAPTITLDDEGGSGGSGTQNTYYNVATSNVSVPTKTGYIFGGYYDGDDGTGNQIINASGVWQKNKSNFTDNSSTPKWIVRANHTLHAKWLPQSLTITSHPTYLTTTDKLNLSISYENIPEGYCYRVKVGGGYWNNSLNQDRDAISGSGSTTFTSYAALPVAANTVVVELWKNDPFAQQTVVSDPVTVTVEPGWEVGVQAKTDGVISTAGGTVSPASVSPTAHIGRTITAEAKVGYDFKGWTANTVNITFDDASELSTTVYATAGGAIYANFAKQSSSYTTTFYAGDHGSINAKGTAIAKNGSASVTIGENETLSATPETGYVFDRWGTTGSVSVASETSASTTVTATDAGGTVTAYYRHRPELGAVTATPSGTQNYAGSPIDFTLSVTSTYLAHPVVVFLVNDGTTTFEVVGAPYGADGSSAVGTIGSDAANTTVHKATFTASAAKSYTVSAKLYEGLLVENFETANYTTWGDIEGGTFSTVTNPYQQAGNGSSHVKQITPNGADWHTAITRTTTAWNNDYQYIHAKMYYQGGTGLKWKISDSPATELSQTIGSTNTWQDVAFNNSGRVTIAFMFPFVAGQTNTFYIDDIILSNEASMTEKASQAATASFSINWDYTVTLNNNGATDAGTESVNVTYGSATGITNITVPTKTGYTFGGYYTEDAGAGTLQINASGVWQNAGYVSGGNWNSGSNQTLYAKWTENMTAVTISASPAGTGTFTVNSISGTSASVGVTTTAAIVATAATDFQFVSWATTNCSVSPTNNRSTTLTGNGSSATGTLTATFTENVASGWYLGGSNPLGNNWETTNTSYPLNKKYRGMTGVFYRYVESISKDGYYTVHNGTTRYRPSTGFNETFGGAGWSNKVYMSNTTKSANVQFNANGNYYICVDTRGTYPYIWYETSEPDRFNYHSVNVTGVENAKGTCKVTLGSTSGFETTRFANGETFYVTITGVSGWIPTITIGGVSTTFWKEASSYSASGTMSTSDIAVTISYTASRAVTFAKTTGCNSLSATGPSSTAVTTGTKVKDGTVIRFAQTNSTGYTFSKWYSNTTGTSGTEYSTSSSAYDLTISSTAYTIYPLYTDNMTTVNLVASPTGKGTFTCGGNTVTSVSAGVTTHPSVTAVPATGYHLTGTIWSESSSYISLSATNTASTTITATGETGKSADLTATFTPNTYRVQFHRNGGAGDVVYQDFTYDVAQNLTANSYTKTGYNFAGWALTTSGDVAYADEAEATNLTSTDGATFHLYAKWTPKQSALTLDKQTSATGYGSAGTVSTTPGSATYNAAMPTLSGTMPTAANGYAFMGFYDATGGGGTKYYNADGSSAHTWDKDTESGTTLYAYYKKAEITALVADPGVIAPGETITITPTIEPTPTGTTKVCYELQYSNGTPLPSQPTFTPGVGNAVSFPVPSASATYIIQATLAKGSSCPADPGDVLSTRTTTFQVAGEHTVTIRYQDSDGRTLQASASIEARPLTWTTAGDITPPTITGYKFKKWVAGDGVSINGEDANHETTTSSIQIKATYDGTLTAVYDKKRLIYFNNTLGWSKVYVYFYKNDSYWESTGSARGSGANGLFEFTSYPYSENYHGQMTQIDGTNIYYFDAEAAGVPSSYDDVVFTEANQHGNDYFYNTKAVRRGDYKSTTLPMFVPINSVSETKNGTKYYNHGYWMNYPENTGYVLHVYAGTGYGTSDQLQEIPFEFTEDKTLPMSVNVELNAGVTYGFEIHRADGTKLGENSYTLQSGNSGDEGQTVRTLDKSKRSIITTAVAGDYTFKLNYGKVSSEYHYLIGVHYPVVVGDYRILYTDDATWSKGAHAPDYAWYHDSRTIHKENGAKDIVSFYVKYDSDTEMKFQKVNSITANTGAVGWTDSVGGTIDISSVKKDGVYNFYLSQANGVIRVDSIRPYTGKYYIRTDCAGATKWENFRTSDHEMTYSEYTETNHGYSHYYPHWVEATRNVKFCIANDYSPSITDTLVADYGTVIANIDAGGYLQNYGANIRFMWNQSTNKIWRAYIGGSSNITDRFLVLEGDAKMFDEAGNALTGVNQDHRIQGEVDTYLGTDNQVILYDDENFVYERTIQVNTGARAKLTAKYNNNVQYFRGSAGAFADGTTVELLGGDAAGKHTMRIVYDFKTNRLVTAYVPSGTIEDDIAINADLMIVRNHQEAGQQLLFNGGSLSEVHTVYGVMRFNRWTLNNKETTGSHDPVGDPKSAYERALYWISFPFNVNLSDVFGFGTYGTHWIIMEYDGAARAKEGYWADSKGFWKYVTNRTNKVLEAGKGYVLALDLDLMKYNDATFWSNNIEQVELFFPSAAEVNNISETNVQTTVDSHECTINRHTQAEQDAGTDTNINKNRTKADSHWNMIGIPSYANYGTTLKDGAGGSTITWNSNPYTNDLPFLYEWNMVDNTYTVQSGTTYPFKSMHAYMVQYHGNLYWSLASATPVSPIVARRTYADKPQNIEMRIELQQNEKAVDQTFVKLSNDENVSTNFAFDEDLCKEYNANKANIYTIVENYLPVAGNTLPMSDQTTVVPVGIKIASTGDYTFAIPEGTNGVGVTLIDNETGVRTSLSALDYTINLPAGTYNERFLLEISPIRPISTDLENTEYRIQNTDVRKVLIDGILYIVKDGVMYDARGSRVQ